MLLWKKWWEIEFFGTSFQTSQKSLEEERPTKILRETIIKKENGYEVGKSFNEIEKKMEKNFGPVLVQLRSLEKRLEKDAYLKISNQPSISNDVERRYVSELPEEKLY